jgi:hypothetical protein
MDVRRERTPSHYLEGTYDTYTKNRSSSSASGE